MPVERLFRSMGSDAHLVVVGGDADLVDRAVARIEELERRWTRFSPDSEVSRLNGHAGTFVEVSPDTILLVERAVEAWRITGGRFDPTVLGDLLRAGYDRTFDAIEPQGPPGSSALVIGCTDIEIAGDHVRLPAGTGFDAGGIGKGLAADLVVTEVMAAGAAGVCVNLGGDLRVEGRAPDGAWTVAVEHPRAPEPLAHLALANGAVASSTTLKRRWPRRGAGGDGYEAHHLIDPSTGEPSDTDIEFATVIAGEAWRAEALAKGVLLRGSARAFDLLDQDAAALVVDRDGHLAASPHFSDFVTTLGAPT